MQIQLGTDEALSEYVTKIKAERKINAQDENNTHKHDDGTTLTRAML